jgi:hypothetical protein
VCWARIDVPAAALIFFLFILFSKKPLDWTGGDDYTHTPPFNINSDAHIHFCGIVCDGRDDCVRHFRHLPEGGDFLFIYSWNVSPHPKMNAISQLDWRSSVAERLIPVERNEIEVAQLRFSFPPPSISLISPL